MIAKFGFTNKKINSTSRKYTEIFEADVILKSDTSIVTPIFKILGGRFPIYNDDGEIIGWNEIEPINFDKVKNCNYIEYNGAYYWINDIISDTNWVSEFVCSRDVLATFLPNIKKTSAYVKYGPWDLTDKKGYLDDKRFSPDLESYYENVYLDTDIVNFTEDKDDYLVLWTVNSLGYNEEQHWDYGTVTLACSFKIYLACCLLWAKSYGSDGTPDLKDIGQFLYKQTSGTFAENVYSAKLYPISYSNLVAKYPKYFTDFEGTVGPYSITTAGFPIKRVQVITPLLSNKNKSGSEAKINLPIAKPNTPFSKYNFLKGEKYNEILLITPEGVKNISSNKFIKHDSSADIYYQYYFDLFSGNLTLALKEFTGGNDGDIYATATWNMGIDVINFASSAEGEGRIFKNGIGTISAGIGASSITSGALTSIASGITSNIGRASVIAAQHLPVSENNLDKLVSMESKGLKAAKTAESYFKNNPISTSSIIAMSTGIGAVISDGGNRSQSQIQNFSDGLTGFYVSSWAWYSKQFLSPARLYVKTYIPSIMNTEYNSEEDNYKNFCDKYGYPVMNYYKVGEINGYYECANFDVVCGTDDNTSLTGSAITLQEASSINSLLNSGVYIED